MIERVNEFTYRISSFDEYKAVYQRSVEDRGGYKKKYGEPIPVKDVVLTVTWGVGVSILIANFVLNLVSAKQMIKFNDDGIYYRGVLLRTYSRRNVGSETEYVANAMLGFRFEFRVKT